MEKPTAETAMGRYLPARGSDIRLIERLENRLFQ